MKSSYLTKMILMIKGGEKMKVKVRKKPFRKLNADWINLKIYGLAPSWLRLTKKV